MYYSCKYLHEISGDWIQIKCVQKDWKKYLIGASTVKTQKLGTRNWTTISIFRLDYK